MRVNTMIYRDLSILWCLINILFIFSQLYESRFPGKKTFFLNLICMGGLIILNMVLVLKMGVIWMGKYFILTCTIPSFFYFFYTSKDRNGRFFFTFCLADIMGFWIMAVSNLISYAFGENFLLMFLLRIFMFLLLEYFVVRYVKKTYHLILQFVKKGWGGFAFASGLFYLFFALMSGWPTRITERPQELPSFILLLLIIPTVYLTIFALLYYQCRLDTRLQNEAILQSQLTGFRHQLQIFQEAEEKNKILRHDLRHYMNQLSVCLNDGNLQAAQSYLQHFEELCSVSAVTCYCKNPTMNSTLSYYVSRAEELGIRVNINFKADCKNLSDETEFSIMMANAFENAINGCLKVPEARKREIRLICLEEYQLLFAITNTCEEKTVLFDENHIPISGSPGHGIGTRSILAYAHKNNAAVDYQLEKGFFKLRILFPPAPESMKQSG